MNYLPAAIKFCFTPKVNRRFVDVKYVEKRCSWRAVNTAPLDPWRVMRVQTSPEVINSTSAGNTTKGFQMSSYRLHERLTIEVNGPRSVLHTPCINTRVQTVCWTCQRYKLIKRTETPWRQWAIRREGIRQALSHAQQAHVLSLRR